MDVTYISSTFANMAEDRHIPLTSTRIMEMILKNQKKLNVIYSDFPKNVVIEYYNYCLKFPINDYRIFHKEFIKNNIHKVETEYVLLTMGNFYEVFFLIELLKVGKKVVIGGPLTKLYNLKTIREMVSVNGGESHLNNLLIVRPYINETIDLFDVIKKWEDIGDDIKYNIESLYLKSVDDSYYKFIPEFKINNIKVNQISIYLSTYCAWGKCNFCTYIPDNSLQFYSKDNLEETIQTTIDLLNRYNIKKLMFGNPEFYFNKDNIKILEMLKANNIKVIILSGIKLLNNDHYFNNLIKYHEIIDYIITGIESLDDFSLKLLGKSHTFNDVIKAASRLIIFNNTTNNPIKLIGLYMANLATKNNQHVIDNYNRQNILLKIFESSNTSYTPDTSAYNFMPLNRYVTNNPYLKPRGNHLTVLNDYIRYDENGNEMLKDSEIVDTDLDNKLIKYIRY